MDLLSMVRPSATDLGEKNDGRYILRWKISLCHVVQPDMFQHHLTVIIMKSDFGKFLKVLVI